MTLKDALGILNARNRRSGEKKTHYLACGFEPLHLKTFLQALLVDRLPESCVAVEHGIYGDLIGNLESASKSDAIAAAVVLEWSDIDPRLGLRSTGGWSDHAKADIPAVSSERYAKIEAALMSLSRRMPVAVSPPSLPLPPIGNTIQAQISRLELQLEQELAAFLLRISGLPGIRVVQRFRNELMQPFEERLDVKFELTAGFPYTLKFASALAESLVRVLYQPAAKKGLISDLDDTFWSGLVGEVGPEAVSWHQEHHTQAYGLYQQMLGHLASCGVLVGICSKNELSNVEAALARPDLLVEAKSLFPVCANWEPKSKSIARILQAWNIGADAVVFVDDSPMELDEVKQAFPGITCIPFSGKDPSKVWRLLGELRDLFGKPVVMEEDRLRQASLRASAQIQEMGESAASPEFLANLHGTVTLDWRMDPSDPRPLELINKTNQFNLNGLRIEEGDWQRRLEAPNTFVAVLSYTDKFGPLGKVAVITGERQRDTLAISQWVMSCRAFSRRLEHHAVAALFRQYPDVRSVDFALRETGRNQPLRQFFQDAGISPASGGAFRLSRDEFLGRYPVLPHQVVDLVDERQYTETGR